MISLSFDSSPPVPLWRAMLPKRRKLRPGESLPEIELRCERLTPGDVAAFRAVCGQPAAPSLPLTWPHILLTPLHLALATHPDLPLPAAGLVHVRNLIRQRRPIGLDEPLSARCLLSDQRLVKQGLEIDLLSEVFVRGERVWESVTTALCRAVRGVGEGRTIEPDRIPHAERCVGWRLPADLGRRYAAVCGDYNPIHLHPLTSRPFGFSRPIIHGMWSLARAVAELDLPVAQRPVELEVNFRRPIFLPGEAIFTASAEEDGERRFDLRGRGGRLHAFGAARLI